MSSRSVRNSRSGRTYEDQRPPKEIPGPSQQGCVGTCVAHSIAKTVCQAAEKLNPPINFHQNEVIPQVIQLGGNIAAKHGSWPDGPEWNGKCIYPKENGTGATGGPDGKTYTATFNIQKCEVADYDKQNQHVLVLRPEQCPGLSAESGLHCVYVTRKTPKYWFFWNSHGQQPKEMRIAIEKPGNILYKVAIDIQELRKDTAVPINTEIFHGDDSVRKYDGEENTLVQTPKEQQEKQSLVSDKKDEWTDVKVKFKNAKAKLKKHTEKGQISIIKENLDSMRNIWEEVEKSQASYLIQLMKSGEKVAEERLCHELTDMEDDRNQTVKLAEKAISHQAEVIIEEREKKEEDLSTVEKEGLPNSKTAERREMAKLKLNQAMDKLNHIISKKKLILIPSCIQQITNTWKEFSTAHDLFALEICQIGDKKKSRELNDEFTELEFEKEDIIQKYTTEVDQTYEDKSNKKGKRIISNPKSDEEKETSDDEESKPKRRRKMTISKASDQVTTEDGENVQKTIASILSKIPVSKKQYEEYHETLKDQLVKKWVEESVSKLFQGVEKGKWEEFLVLFKESTGIDDAVYKEFQTMKFAERMDDKVQRFSCEGTKTSGKYGLFVCHKRPQEDKVDVAYVMFTYEAEFVGPSRLKMSSVKEIPINAAEAPDMFFRKGEMDEMVDNFIVCKALKGFERYGAIPKVTYIEDQEQVPKITQTSKSKPRIEEIDDES